MQRFRVIVAPQAVAQVETIAGWWQANRPSSPGLFVEEFAAALTRLGSAPSAGAAYRLGPRPDLRRLLLPRTRYHVYYATAEGARRVSVLALARRSRRQAQAVIV
jgi:hypothetical protein